MTSLCLPFVKFVHASAIFEFGGDNFGLNNSTLRDDRDIESTIMEKET
jgi:hypothetical protein